jgi:hypothetical protein
MQLQGLPLLSLHDPDGAASTSLDPLGLTPIGEQLAVELIPGVRERQSHPRYLTAIAVAHAVCQNFPFDTVAADGISEPWQVFEWYVVEGLVRCSGADSDAKVPGSQKTKKSIAQGLPLNATRYLKTPTVFGFHGVYRLLARTLRVEEANYLGDFGNELLSVWQNEQGLSGFTGSVEGRGKVLRQGLTEAVRDGLKAAATTRSGGWFGWKFFFDHLEPAKAGPKEAQLIWQQLRTGQTVFCREVLDFIVSAEGRTLFQDKDTTERMRYAALKKVASPELRARIATIQCYERFARVLHDAFEACRYEITRTRRGVQPAVLAYLPPVVKAAQALPDAYVTVAESLPDFARRARFESVFQMVAQQRSAADLVVAIYEHHLRIQKAKPPEGKAPWLERHYDGSLLIRPEYQLEKEPKPNAEFVNPYRLQPLWNFACDLGQV